MDHEVVRGFAERWLDGLVRIGNHPAAGDLADRRLHAPLIGEPFVLAFLADMMRSRVLALAIGLVIAAIVAFALLPCQRRPPPSP